MASVNRTLAGWEPKPVQETHGFIFTTETHAQIFSIYTRTLYIHGSSLQNNHSKKTCSFTEGQAICYNAINLTYTVSPCHLDTPQTLPPVPSKGAGQHHRIQFGPATWRKKVEQNILTETVFPTAILVDGFNSSEKIWVNLDHFPKDPGWKWPMFESTTQFRIVLRHQILGEWPWS